MGLAFARVGVEARKIATRAEMEAATDAGFMPDAAIRSDALFSTAAEQLTAHPEMGQAGQVKGTRELIPHKCYRFVYEIEDNAVWILALVHTARQRPSVRD